MKWSEKGERIVREEERLLLTAGELLFLLWGLKDRFAKGMPGEEQRSRIVDD